MSGGVDSSVAAKLLLDKGFYVMGIFLYFWKEEGSGEKRENKCCSSQALMDARRVCQKLGIKLYTLNFRSIFKQTVVDNFLSEYNSGKTPNPCIRCNRFVKLGELIKKARVMGFDYVASGHYARLWREFPITKLQSPNNFQKSNSKKQIVKLLAGKDKQKDQSYFLSHLTREQLSHMIFPLGEYTKDEVRQMARGFGLPVAEKKESQEICFIPGKSHNEFLARHLKLKPGPIKTIDGKIVGEHQGLSLYTPGQRKGLEIGGIGPFYALKKDYKTNTLYAANDRDDPYFYTDELETRNVNWISQVDFPLECQAMIRYQGELVDCTVTKKQPDDGCYRVKFDKKIRAITAGQSVVFYQGEEALGGGVIQ